MVTTGPRTEKVRVLLYVNQVFYDDYTGQGTFEREVISALRDRVAQLDRARLKVFTVRRPGVGASKTSADPDAVALLLNKAHPVGYVAHQMRLLVALGRALIRYRRDDVSIYVRYAASSIAPALLATLLRRRMVIRTGPTLARLDNFDKKPSPAVFQAVRLSQWWNCHHASVIIVATDTTRRWIEQTYPVARGKVRVVHNGVNVDLFPISPPDRARWGLAQSGLVLGYIGHISEDEGIDTVIRALAVIQRETGSAPQLLVVGDGPHLNALRALAAQTGVASSVIFAGQRPHSEIPGAIAACDVLLAPFSKRLFATVGSSALKLFEYLACDKPVLASRADDHQFLVDHGVGWLAEPDDTGAWVAAIRERMAAQSVELHGRGRRLAQESYSFDSIARKFWSACFEGHEGGSSEGRRDVPQSGFGSPASDSNEVVRFLP